MDYKKYRKLMVEHQIRERGIYDQKLLNAFLKVKRHLFVTKIERRFAYEDRPLPIGHGQTISQPYIVALMVSLLELKEDDIVLEIGTGSGYQTAILAELSKKVYSIELIDKLAKRASNIIEKLGYDNVFIKTGDGTSGWKNKNGEFFFDKKNTKPKFDAIIISAGAPQMPQKLIEQLNINGRLVIPIGSRFMQDLIRVTKTEKGIKKENFGGCMFVPLIGEQGWNS